jgi:hypothetical protein
MLIFPLFSKWKWTILHKKGTSIQGLLGCDDIYCCGRIPLFLEGFPSTLKMEAAWSSETLVS